MNELIHLSPKRLHLILSPRPMRRKLMTALASRLALDGPLLVLDGGNSFDAYALSRLLRQKSSEWQAALERTRLARAFTCHQMSTLLEQTAALDSPAPLPQPTLVFELLDTFYDENVPLPERLRLLEGCLEHLRHLAEVTQVAVSAAPLEQGQPAELLERLSAAAGQVWHFEMPRPASPPRLF
jgi:hypothetical protein